MVSSLLGCSLFELSHTLSVTFVNVFLCRLYKPTAVDTDTVGHTHQKAIGFFFVLNFLVHNYNTIIWMFFLCAFNLYCCGNAVGHNVVI